jgi:hypothetical protein
MKETVLRSVLARVPVEEAGTVSESTSV